MDHNKDVADRNHSGARSGRLGSSGGARNPESSGLRDIIYDLDSTEEIQVPTYPDIPPLPPAGLPPPPYFPSAESLSIPTYPSVPLLPPPYPGSIDPFGVGGLPGKPGAPGGFIPPYPGPIPRVPPVPSAIPLPPPLQPPRFDPHFDPPRPVVPPVRPDEYLPPMFRSPAGPGAMPPAPGGFIPPYPGPIPKVPPFQPGLPPPHRVPLGGRKKECDDDDGPDYRPAVPSRGRGRGRGRGSVRGRERFIDRIR